MSNVTETTDAPVSTQRVLTVLSPTFDRILVERVAEENVTKGGIILPDQSVTKPNQGVIVAMGPQVPRVVRGINGTPDYYPGGDAVQHFELGQLVEFGSYAGIDRIVEDESGATRRFVLLKQDEITCIIHTTTVEESK